MQAAERAPATLPVKSLGFFAPPGDGFVALQVIGPAAAPVLQIECCKPGSSTPCKQVPLL